MSTAEQAVRDAAVALDDAIRAAHAEGLVVAWPRSAAELPAIAISATGKADVVAAEAEPKPKRRKA